MIDASVIADWRLQYGDIYTANLGGKDYYFRALTLGEIEFVKNRFVEDPSSADLEDAYVEVGLIYPNDNLDKMKAGYISSLAQEIMRVSGISDAEFTIQSLQDTRIAVEEDIVEMMKVFVMTAMPIATEDYLNSLNMKQLVKKVIQSEKILSLQQTVNGIESDGGVVFQILAVQDEPPAQQKKPVDRDELLRRIRRDEKEQTGRVSNIEQLDETLLVKAAGTINPNDPIARKLMEALR